MAEIKMPSPEDFPNNSDHKKAPERVEGTQSVVRGEVKVREKRGLRRLKEEWVREDGPSVGDYILFDVLLPSLKNLILDIGHGAIDAAFGEIPGNGRSYRSRRDDRRSYISYDRMYDSRDSRREDRRRMERKVADRLDEFEFEYRDDAEDVLEQLVDYLDEYGDVPVSYFYDRVGKTVPHDFTKDDWGWTNLSSAKVCRLRGGGYYIDLPKARPI